MKITFVYPRFEKFLGSLPELEPGLVEYYLGDYTTPPSLGIPLLAALTPPEFEIELLDDNSGQPINYDAPTDLVAINCFTPQASPRVRDRRQFSRPRQKGQSWAGFFPSFMAGRMPQTRRLGEPRRRRADLAEDSGRCSRPARSSRATSAAARTDPADIPAARREIFYQNDHYDWDEDLVQVMRGCLTTARMCPLPAQMGDRIRFRPIERVVEEVRSLKHENVYLADDMLFFPHRRVHEYSRALFRGAGAAGQKVFRQLDDGPEDGRGFHQTSRPAPACGISTAR